MKYAFPRLICFLALAVIVTTALPARPRAQEDSQKTADTIYDLKNARENGIMAPKAIYSPDPEYTDQARKRKVRGSVLLSLVVTAEGDVREPKVIRSLDQDLDKQAVAAVSKWKFTPATKDGQPVSVRIKVEASFNIK